MNSYFKTATEVEALFQQAIETLHQQGYDAAQELFNTAWRHDPYHLQGHYELAIYYATVKDVRQFRYYFFICWNLDAAYKERILTHETVLNVFNTAELEEIIALKEKEDYPIKEFTAINPLGGSVYLRFHPSHVQAIVTIYKEYNTAWYYDNIFNIQETPPKWPGVYTEEELLQAEYFRLYYYRDRGRVDQPTEQVYEMLKKLSPYLQDVRFLIGSEYEEIMDEVLIQNGAFYLYRHFLDSDLIGDERAYFETLVEAHPDDNMLSAWLCKQYLDDVMYEIVSGKEVSEWQHLDKITRLNKMEDPWVDYLFGKLHVMKNEPTAALDRFQKAVGKSPDTVEFLLEGGKWLAIASSEYEKSIDQLTRALTLRKEAELYLYRALALYKQGNAVKGEADIDRCIKAAKPSVHDLFLTGGVLLLDAGWHQQAAKLLQAALAKNEKHEQSLKDPGKPANSDWFINDKLSKLATQRAAINAALARLK
jgi:Tfp pilus assembly protein PilF